MAGRPPKPLALKLLEGNRGKRPLPTNEPKPDPIAPRVPVFLSKDAKKEWKRIAPQLEKLGLLTQVDMATLAGYCESWAQYKKAIEFLHKNGETYALWEREDDGSIKRDDQGKPILRYMQQWPQVSIANKALGNIKSASMQFGLSPSDRGRMTVPGAPEAEDEMEQLLNKKR